MFRPGCAHGCAGLCARVLVCGRVCSVGRRLQATPGGPMTQTAHRTAAIALALALTGSAGALAAGPLSGRTYEGGAPSTGVSEGHRKPTHATGNIILRVSRSGRSVSVRFASSSPVLYCVTQQRVHVQSSHVASIASNGTFKAAVGERFSK